MTREDLKDIIVRVIDNMNDDNAPACACLFSDNQCDDNPQCDITTYYAVGEEG